MALKKRSPLDGAVSDSRAGMPELLQPGLYKAFDVGGLLRSHDDFPAGQALFKFAADLRNIAGDDDLTERGVVLPPLTLRRGANPKKS